MVSECMMLFEYELKIGSLFDTLETGDVLSKKLFVLTSVDVEKEALT